MQSMDRDLRTPRPLDLITRVVGRTVIGRPTNQVSCQRSSDNGGNDAYERPP